SQRERLGAFLERVARRHSYWRGILDRSGLSTSMLADPAVLELLPLANKQTMRVSAREWVREPDEKFQIYQTSGSTGEPLQFPVGIERVVHDVAANWRGTRGWRADIGAPETGRCASPIET